MITIGIRPRAVAGLVLAALIAGRVDASERLTGVACRSVHLQYAAPDCLGFENEVVVRQSQTGTYFCVIGFDMGYFGIQELGDGRKVVLFSVWDPTQGNDPGQVPEDRRVKLVYQDPDVQVRRFGGEGTGGQSFYALDWKPDQPYKFRVEAKVSSNRTAFTGLLLPPGTSEWKRLVCFETQTGGIPLRGLHSFVEDFKRDRDSATRERRALFGPPRAWPAPGAPVTVRRAQFTADGNRAVNIDAGVTNGRFYLATGGHVTNTGARLWSEIRLPEPAAAP